MLAGSKDRYEAFFKEHSLRGSLDLLHPDVIQAHIFVCHGKFTVEENPERAKGKKSISESALNLFQRVSAKAFGNAQSAHFLIATSKPFNPKTPAASPKDFSLISPSELPSHWNLNTLMIFAAAETKEFCCSDIVWVQSFHSQDLSSCKQMWEVSDGSLYFVEFEFATHSKMLMAAILEAQGFEDEVSRSRRSEISCSAEKYEWLFKTQVVSAEQGREGLKRQVATDLAEAFEGKEKTGTPSEFVKYAKRAQNRLEEVDGLEVRCSMRCRHSDPSTRVSSSSTCRSTTSSGPRPSKHIGSRKAQSSGLR